MFSGIFTIGKLLLRGISVNWVVLARSFALAAVTKTASHGLSQRFLSPTVVKIDGMRTSSLYTDLSTIDLILYAKISLSRQV